MTSHEYARRQQQIAEFLLSRPEFDTHTRPYEFFSFYEKEPFVAAVKALGSGKKDIGGTEVKFEPEGFSEITVKIPRDKVCRKIQDAVYDCEPFLSDAEVASLG